MVIAVEQIDHTEVQVPAQEVLLQRQATLYRRLEDGYQQIELAVSRGQAVRRWEDLWLDLLDEYERISDQINAHE